MDIRKFDIRKKLASESGAYTMIEAFIIYPMVFLIVLLLLYMGLHFMQKAYLQREAAQISEYLVKVIKYPGYQEMIPPVYANDEVKLTAIDDKGNISGDAINRAAEKSDPYRYMFGLFNRDKVYSVNDYSGGNVINKIKDYMVESYLPSHGFLKAMSGDAEIVSSQEFKAAEISRKGGYVCAIKANTSQVTVYLGQSFVFSNLFGYIGMGGFRAPICAQSTTFLNDSVEFVRMTDLAFDALNFIAGKLNINTDNIRSAINKITGNSDK